MADIFTDEDKALADQHPSLGASYSASRRIVEKAMGQINMTSLDGITKPFFDELYMKIQDAIEDSIWTDAETNLHNRMWHMVDEIVKGILGGEKWIVEKYALGSRFDCETIRKAIARHFEDEAAKARIADLEAKVAQLEENLKWARRNN